MKEKRHLQSLSSQPSVVVNHIIAAHRRNAMSSRSSGIQNEMLCPTNNPESSPTPEAPKTTAPTQSLPG